MFLAWMSLARTTRTARHRSQLQSKPSSSLDGCLNLAVGGWRAGQNPTWVWVKIKPPGDHRFWSMLPLTRVPFWVPIFDPQPRMCVLTCLAQVSSHPAVQTTKLSFEPWPAERWRRFRCSFPMLEVSSPSMTRSQSWANPLRPWFNHLLLQQLDFGQGLAVETGVWCPNRLPKNEGSQFPRGDPETKAH